MCGPGHHNPQDRIMRQGPSHYQLFAGRARAQKNHGTHIAMGLRHQELQAWDPGPAYADPRLKVNIIHMGSMALSPTHVGLAMSWNRAHNMALGAKDEISQSLVSIYLMGKLTCLAMTDTKT